MVPPQLQQLWHKKEVGCHPLKGQKADSKKLVMATDRTLQCLTS